ncbi:MAG: methyl-accepting chemotaxis protein [Spirochaetia bacterium]
MARISMKAALGILGIVAGAIPTAAVLWLMLDGAGPALVLAAGAGGVVLGGAILFIVGGRIASRLSRTGDAMSRLAGGDLTTRTGARAVLAEADALLRSFDEELAANLQVIMLGMRELAEENRELTHRLSAGAARSRETSEEVVERIGAVRDQIVRLDARIAETSQSFDEINNGITDLRNELESQASAVDETSASVEQMSASIDSVAQIARERNQATTGLLEIVKSGGSQAKTSDEIIEEIAGGVEQISSMVQVINTVAAQTRILSMNAAIEAAHAGEYGRGFAVVADEIRKLAENTSSNTSQISSTLQEFVQRIYAAREASTKTGESFAQISGEIDHFVQAFTEISQSTSELATGSKEMVSGVGSLRESATRIQEQSEAIQTSTRTINEAVESVHQFSGETRGQIDELDAESRRIAEDQKSITETGEQSDACIEQLMTELKYFTMERGDADATGGGGAGDAGGGGAVADTYDAELKQIILDHKKRVIGAKALLDDRLDVEHLPKASPATSCLLEGWLNRAERGDLDPSTISALRQEHELFHQRYNEFLEAYEAGDNDRARRLFEETERIWRGLVSYRETFSGILKELKKNAGPA